MDIVSQGSDMKLLCDFHSFLPDLIHKMTEDEKTPDSESWSAVLWSWWERDTKIKKSINKNGKVYIYQICIFYFSQPQSVWCLRPIAWNNNLIKNTKSQRLHMCKLSRHIYEHHNIVFHNRAAFHDSSGFPDTADLKGSLPENFANIQMNNISDAIFFLN